MFFRSICTGPVSRSTASRFARRHDLAARRVHEHVADVGWIWPAILLAQPDDDRVLVAALAELRGRRSGDVGLNRLGDTVDREAEHRGLRTIDADRELGPARRSWPTRTSAMPGRVLHQRDRLLLDPLGIVEVVAADLERETRASLPPPRMKFSWKLPPPGLARDDDAGDAGQAAPHILRDLIARARAAGRAARA